MDKHAAREAPVAVRQQQQLDQIHLHRPLEEGVEREVRDLMRHRGQIIRPRARPCLRLLEELGEARLIDDGAQHSVAFVAFTSQILNESVRCRT